VCELDCSLTAAFRVAFLAASMALMSGTGALAQAQQAAPEPTQAEPLPARANVKQIALTEKQIAGLLAASKDIQAINDHVKDIDNPDPKSAAQLDAVARRNGGLGGYDEYKNVSENIGLVFAGVDPVTKKYLGRETYIKAQIAQVRHDKKMAPEDKKEKLSDLNDALRWTLPPIEYKGNIALVLKYQDKLSATMPPGE